MVYVWIEIHQTKATTFMYCRRKGLEFFLLTCWAIAMRRLSQHLQLACRKSRIKRWRIKQWSSYLQRYEKL